MKVYISSRQNKKDYIKEITDILNKKGYELSFDWRKIPDLKPYQKNEEKSVKISQEITNSIKKSDLFILISDSGGTDMFIELGIAISENLKKGSPKIYCIGKHNNRSLMLHHPSIKRINSIEELS